MIRKDETKKFRHDAYGNACASILTVLDKRIGNGKETKFGKYIVFVHDRECKFSFVLNPTIENEIFEKVWSSHSGIYVQANLICKKLVKPFIDDKLADGRFPYDLDEKWVKHYLELYPNMPKDAIEENFVDLIVATDNLARDERIGKMFDEIVEAYVGTATKMIGERNGD